MNLDGLAIRRRLLPILLGQVVGLACGIIGIKITSHLVPPAVFGKYGIFLTFTSVGMWVVHAGLVKFINRHWASAPDRPALLREVIKAAVRKLPWLIAASAVAAGAMAGSEWLPFFPAIFLAATLLSAGALAQGALQGAREHWRDFSVSSAGSVTRSFLPPLCYLAAGGAAPALYAGFCLHTLVLAGAGALSLRDYFRFEPSHGAGSRALTSIYNGPYFVLLAIAGWALVALNRWIIAGFYGAVETGYFGLASNLATLIPSVLGTVLLQYFQPDFFARSGEGEAERRQLARRVDQVALLYTAGAALGLIALRLVAPALIGPLIRETYRPALDLLLPAGCFMLAITTGFFYHSMLLAGKRESACGPVDLTAAAILVAAGVITASISESVFLHWLLLSPVVPWTINRPLARRFFFRPSAKVRPVLQPDPSN